MPRRGNSFRCVPTRRLSTPVEYAVLLHGTPRHLGYVTDISYDTKLVKNLRDGVGSRDMTTSVEVPVPINRRLDRLMAQVGLYDRKRYT